MKEQVDNYFFGELSDAEKKKLFDWIEASTENKTEFIQMQNTVTISKLGEVCYKHLKTVLTYKA